MHGQYVTVTMVQAWFYRVLLCSFNDIMCKSLIVIILRNNNGFGHPFLNGTEFIRVCVYVCSMNTMRYCADVAQNKLEYIA